MKNNNLWLTPDWLAPAGVRAVTTLRTGGISTGVYDSLNLATHVGDDLDRVTQNRQMLKQRLNLPAEPIWLQQVHSNKAIDATQVQSLPTADASYSHAAGVVCAVMTADCLPVLACSSDGHCVAAIHAGWRGLATCIITETLTAMRCHDALIWLGPAIGPECFEVGDEVRDTFVGKSTAFAGAFKQQDDRWLADIYQLARIELGFLGIHKIYGGQFCTVTDQARFYSYRRDKETGRMATLIWRD